MHPTTGLTSTPKFHAQVASDTTSGSGPASTTAAASAIGEAERPPRRGDPPSWAASLGCDAMDDHHRAGRPETASRPRPRWCRTPLVLGCELAVLRRLADQPLRCSAVHAATSETNCTRLIVPLTSADTGWDKCADAIVIRTPEGDTMGSASSPPTGRRATLYQVDHLGAPHGRWRDRGRRQRLGRRPVRGNGARRRSVIDDRGDVGTYGFTELDDAIVGQVRHRAVLPLRAKDKMRTGPGNQPPADGRYA